MSNRLIFLTSAMAIAAAFLVLPVATHATSVAAVRTQTMVVIGGDSKVVRGNGDEYGVACKTNVANKVVYGYFGILFAPTRHFTASDIVRRNLNDNGSLADRVSAVEKDISPQIIELVTDLRRNDPSGYKGKILGQFVFGIIFAAVEEHVPKVMMLALKVDAAAQTADGPVVLTPIRSNCPGDCPNGIGFLMLGSHAAAEADTAKYPSIWTQLGTERAVRHLIEDEILEDPDTVGLPITIIRLSDSGIEWVEDSEQCKKDRSSEK